MAMGNNPVSRIDPDGMEDGLCRGLGGGINMPQGRRF